MFSVCTVPPDSMETELGSSNQEASASAGKNTGVVLVTCYAYGSVSLQLCPVVWIPWVSFVMTDEFSMRVLKITSRIGVS